MSIVLQDQKNINNKKEYIELATQKTGVFFTTRKLKNHAVEYQETVNQYKAKQSRLVSEIVSIASECIACAFLHPGTNLLLRYVCDRPGRVERRHRAHRRDCQVCRTLHGRWLPSDSSPSFAHVAVNAPEAYVKPTVLEKGSHRVSM